jgi:hypothetical protein
LEQAYRGEYRMPHFVCQLLQIGYVDSAETQGHRQRRHRDLRMAHPTQSVPVPDRLIPYGADKNPVFCCLLCPDWERFTSQRPILTRVLVTRGLTSISHESLKRRINNMLYYTYITWYIVGTPIAKEV